MNSKRRIPQMMKLRRGFKVWDFTFSNGTLLFRSCWEAEPPKKNGRKGYALPVREYVNQAHDALLERFGSSPVVVEGWFDNHGVIRFKRP